MKVALAEGRLTKWRDVLDELTLFDFKVLAVFDTLNPFGGETGALQALRLNPFWFGMGAPPADYDGIEMTPEQMAMHGAAAFPQSVRI
jgi:hypothetical protein